MDRVTSGGGGNDGVASVENDLYEDLDEYLDGGGALNGFDEREEEEEDHDDDGIFLEHPPLRS